MGTLEPHLAAVEISNSWLNRKTLPIRLRKYPPELTYLNELLKHVRGTGSETGGSGHRKNTPPTHPYRHATACVHCVAPKEQSLAPGIPARDTEISKTATFK